MGRSTIYIRGAILAVFAVEVFLVVFIQGRVDANLVNFGPALVAMIVVALGLILALACLVAGITLLFSSPLERLRILLRVYDGFCIANWMDSLLKLSHERGSFCVLSRLQLRSPRCLNATVMQFVFEGMSDGDYYCSSEDQN